MKKSFITQDFILLMVGKFISAIGTGLQNFGLSLYVLAVTGSATKFASVMVVALIPNLILRPIGGVIGDRFDRKKIIVNLDILSGVLTGIAAIYYLRFGKLDIWVIYVMVMGLSAMSSIFNPAANAVIPSIVKKENLVEANSINTTAMTLSGIIAPLLGGAIYGIFGILPLLIVNSISFLISGISESFINIPNVNKSNKKFTKKDFKRDFKEGIDFIKGNRTLKDVLVIGIIVNFAFNPVFSIAYPYISKQIIKVTDMQFGIMQSIMVGGMIVAPAIAAIWLKKSDIRKILILSVAGLGIFDLFIMGNATDGFLNMFEANLIPYITLVTLGVGISLISTTASICLKTVLQKETPNELMGRVGSVLNTLLIAAMPLGQMTYGLLIDVVDIKVCMMFSAAIILAEVLVLSVRMKSKTKEMKQVA